MLPDQQYHSTLIQAFDPVRLFWNRTEEARRIMEARTEVLLNLLFGREVVLPAGQIADSPAVAVVYREVMLAFDQLPPAKRERIRAKPFRIALEHGYEDYTDYVARYIDVGAPIIQLPLPEQRRLEERAAGLALVKRLYIERQYDELERVVGRPGFAEYANLVRVYLDARAVARPAVSASAPPDLLATVRRRVQGLRTGDYSDYLMEIEDALPFFASAPEFGTYRGLWYAHAERFGSSWDIVRHWLDQSLYVNLTRYYGVQHPVFTTKDLPAARYSARDILMPELAEYNVESQPVEIGSVDWKSIWEIVADSDFQRSLARMTEAVSSASLSHHLRDAVEEHANVLNAALSTLKLDLARGRLVMRPKAGAGVPIVAGALIGNLLFPIMVGAFVPLPELNEAAALMSFASEVIGTGAGAALGHESRIFTLRREQEIVGSNREKVDQAAEHIIAVTKLSSWDTPSLRVGQTA